jgi:cytochrome P450
MLIGARNLATFGSIAGSLPRLASIIKPLLWRFCSQHSPAVIARETLKRVNARYAEMADSSFCDSNGVPNRPDMLTGFIGSQNSLTKQPFTKKDVISMCTSVFGAGSDTTAVALMAFFYFIVRDPAIYARVEKEVDDAFEKGTINRPVSYADGTKLEYTQACLKEAMRLMTPVGMEMPRYVVPEGFVIASRYFLPGGTEVGASAFTFHRAKAVYGQDAELFRPQRWLDIRCDERARLERNNLVVRNRLLKRAQFDGNVFPSLEPGIEPA